VRWELHKREVITGIKWFIAMVCAAAYARKRKAKSEESQSEGSGVKENLGGDYIEMLSGKSDGVRLWFNKAVFGVDKVYKRFG
jgi:hypothetical protein